MTDKVFVSSYVVSEFFFVQNGNLYRLYKLTQKKAALYITRYQFGGLDSRVSIRPLPSISTSAAIRS